MKNRLIALVWPILVAFVAGCTEAPTGMTTGEVLYRRKCSSCHSLIEPGRFDLATWGAYIERYGRKLPPSEKTAILDHLAARQER